MLLTTHKEEIMCLEPIGPIIVYLGTFLFNYTALIISGSNHMIIKSQPPFMWMGLGVAVYKF